MRKLLALAAALAADASAQCVMCFRTAAAQQQARAQVLNHGILIMLFPPVLILAFFVVLAYRRRSTWSRPVDAVPLDGDADCVYSPVDQRVR